MNDSGADKRNEPEATRPDGEPAPVAEGAMTKAKAKTTLVAVWGAMLVGVLTLGAVLVALAQGDADPGATKVGPVRVGVIALGGLVVLMAASYYARLQAYKKGWKRFAVEPQAYFMGNLIVFAALEGASMLALLLGAFVGDRLACYGIATAAFAALLLNYPNGNPMEPQQPRL